MEKKGWALSQDLSGVAPLLYVEGLQLFVVS